MKNIDKIHDYAREKHIPIMKDDGLLFLLDYIQKHEDIHNILELGTAVGHSAIQMANIRWDMQIDTLEVNREMYEMAIQNIKDLGLADRIHCHLVDAIEYETDKIYDLVFVDAAKSQYKRYMEHFMVNTRKGSVFVFDNLNFHGIVEDPSLSHNRSTLQMTRKIKRFKEALFVDERFDVDFYSEIGDGIAIAKRRI